MRVGWRDEVEVLCQGEVWLSMLKESGIVYMCR